ncbi:unnamed protein product [Parascedosporium putredinis]|uniref:Uncharacterized protein n=1 Tax=Parascedosporium putredinis TaxID=1442378 RepID=A0A9P1H5M9_9PEZI|nr:unnamed protein product [Parascedosporium putredinis]CAI7999481.1 unnamed protein product [Parascedosporium putredinis]
MTTSPSPKNPGSEPVAPAATDPMTTSHAPRNDLVRGDLGRPLQQTTSPKLQRLPAGSGSDADSESNSDQSDLRRRRRHPKPSRPFLYIAPKQREIPVSVISSKWTPLSRSSVSAATQILQLASRPVLQTRPPGPRRDAAAAALRVATRRVVNSISRGLPFPRSQTLPPARPPLPEKFAAPDGREVELDFEAVADETAALERRLDPLLHSIQLLRQEDARLVEAIKKDEEELEELRKNAKRELGVWRESLRKKSHPLLPARWNPDANGREKLVLAPEQEPPQDEWAFADFPNPEITALASQLTNHLSSIRDNTAPVENLDASLDESFAALRRVLAGVLPHDRYEAVLHGDEDKS